MGDYKVSVRKRVFQGLERAVLRAKAFGIGWGELISLLAVMWGNKMTVGAGTVRVRGWTFRRMENGFVGITKESLVHDDILLGDDEWDEIVTTLWTPPSEEEMDAGV